MERDFFTLCANAQTYNEESSLIYADSVRLRNVFIEIRRRYESGQNSDDSDDIDKGKTILIKKKKTKTNGILERGLNFHYFSNSILINV